MASRHRHWFKQAQSDLRHTRHAAEDGDFDSSSVTIKSANREAVEAAVRAYVQRLRRERPEVKRVIWFGSWVTGRPVPGSDVDLCLVLSRADKPYRERLPDYLPLGFPVGVDLFPYTEAELKRLRRTDPAWHRTLVSGRTL